MPEKKPPWWTHAPEWVLATFAVLSFIVLWIQLRDARSTFRKDQRPYVWLANGTKDSPAIVIGNATDIQGKKILVSMQYTNYGKSPAILVRKYHAMVLGSPPSIASRPWIANKKVLPTGKVDFFSDVSKPLSDQELETYLKVQDGVTIFATWQYLDSSGHKYETELCMTRLNFDGSWEYCETHNDIKDCSEDICEP